MHGSLKCLYTSTDANDSFCLSVCLSVCLFVYLFVFPNSNQLAAHSVLSSHSNCDSLHISPTSHAQIVLCECGMRHSVHVCLLK